MACFLLMRVLLIAIAAALFAATPAQAAEISTELIAKAKQEGQVVYYTDLIVDQIVRPLTAAFEAKYGVKTAFVRGDSQVNSVKLLNERKASRDVDVRAHVRSQLLVAPAWRGNSPPRTVKSCCRSIATPIALVPRTCSR
jgi:ABC-type thiamine transport system substrate-binding protein